MRIRPRDKHTPAAGKQLYKVIFSKYRRRSKSLDTAREESNMVFQMTSFIEKMKENDRNIVVFYGSQTGTARGFATRLVKDAQNYSMRGMIADLQEYNMSELSRLTEIANSLAVFCMATCGEGEPTDNAQDFYGWMQGTYDSLEGVRFAVFGLGNKTYEHFNTIGKNTDQWLSDLGATRVCDLGLGDADNNFRQYELVVHNDISVSEVYSGELGHLMSFQIQKTPFNEKNPFLAPVILNRKLNKGGNRHLMHLELDISGSEIRYTAGDHAAVYPANDESLVNRLGERLGVNLDTIITLKNLDVGSDMLHPFPCPTSYRTALTHYLDITNPPRSNLLFELAQYASEPREQRAMREMACSSTEGKALYRSWVLDAERDVLAVLEDLPSLRPPVDHLCELLPRLQARFYSIASSAKVHPTSIHICAAVVEHTTKTGRVFKGVATNWLKNKVVTDSGPKPNVPMYVRKSQFHLPLSAAKPVVMIGPGTGIAPFMGFIQERAWLKEQGEEVGETILYFGCRHRHEDFLYQEELQEFEKTGVLTQLNVAFSRQQKHKVYVQHLLKKNKEHLWNLIHLHNAHIYVCGDAHNMARDVQATFHAIAEEVEGLTHAEAVDYFKRLATSGRYSQDVWS
ncbi:NADPH--cytochrome P450 reductase isoform X3 [Brachyhypopomus gauderio]|uniref:NADPH--cytochrome P450 reductase isoform X3 n=1 Tax=Brachyhypopomus gauderio TaxID=698409 RepID=UPI004041A7DF